LSFIFIFLRGFDSIEMFIQALHSEITLFEHMKSLISFIFFFVKLKKRRKALGAKGTKSWAIEIC